MNFITQSKKEFFKSIILKAFEGASFNYDDLSVNKLSNKPLWVNIRVNPVKLSGVIKSVCIIGRDITEQKEKDLKIAQTKNLLKRTEGITQVGSVEVDYVNNRHTWSDGLYNLLGHKPGEIVPSKENFVQFLHPEDEASYLNRVCSTTQIFTSSGT